MPKPPGPKTEKNNEKSIKKKVQDQNEMTLEDIDPEKAETIARWNLERFRRKDYGCVDFWVCLVFQSWEQQQEFLKQIKSPVLYDAYVDGETFAEEIGKPVTPNVLKYIPNKVNKKRTSMVFSKSEKTDAT